MGLPWRVQLGPTSQGGGHFRKRGSSFFANSNPPIYCKSLTFGLNFKTLHCVKAKKKRMVLSLMSPSVDLLFFLTLTDWACQPYFISWWTRTLRLGQGRNQIKNLLKYALNGMEVGVICSRAVLDLQSLTLGCSLTSKKKKKTRPIFQRYAQPSARPTFFSFFFFFLPLFLPPFFLF